ALLSGRETQLGDLAAESLTNRDFLSTRIAYKLNLRGPANMVQTACSTSLVAIHQACRALVAGECQIAAAGGINISRLKKEGHIYREGMILTPDGHCRAFDAEAKGTIFGDGVGVVVLKPLKTAQQDNDHIYAVIKGTATNNDGNRKTGFTAPSIEGQAEVIRAAFTTARVEPRSIGYVEANGTGTGLGDPMEIEGLKMAFTRRGQQLPPRTCAVGTVKTNLGHLTAASGVAAFIKTVLSLKHRLLFPSLHFKTPNPKIDFENTPFYVVNKLTRWKIEKNPLRAGVSSFGIGGTNAHTIIEEWRPEPPHNTTGELDHKTTGKPDPENQIILLSAKTKTALEKTTANLVNHLQNNPGIDLAKVAYTLQVGRKPMEHRRTTICTDITGAVENLSNPLSEAVKTYYAEQRNRPVLFMFPGQGTIYHGMGAELYRYEPIFRETINHCFEILKKLLGFDIGKVLYPPEQTAKEKRTGEKEKNTGEIHDTRVALPLQFAVGYALAKLLMHRGIQPAAVIGHDAGEYTAAVVSGVFNNLEEALKTVVLYSRLQAAHGTGTPGGPHTTPTRMTEPAAAELETQLGRFTLNKPGIPLISSQTGTWLRDEESVEPAYWAGHRRRGVEFTAGLDRWLKKKHSYLWEVGPGRTLTEIARRHPSRERGHILLNTQPHPEGRKNAAAYHLEQMGIYWTGGGSVDWTTFYPAPSTGEPRGTTATPGRIPLPTYPFESKQYKVEEIDSLMRPPGTQTAGTEAAAMNLNHLLKVTQERNNRGKETLPTHMRPRPELSTEYSAPRDNLEKKLVDIWTQYLGIQPVGIHDNFFQLGGDSLKAMMTLNRCSKLLQETLHTTIIFQTPTIAEIAHYIKKRYPKATARIPSPGGEEDLEIRPGKHGMQKKRGENKYPTVEPAEKKEYYKLSSAQHRLYFIRQFEPHSTAYNLPQILTLAKDIDTKKVVECFRKLIIRHETLRTTLHMINERPVQVIHENVPFKIELHDPGNVRNSPDNRDVKNSTNRIIKEFIRPFDLSRAPLIRVAVIKEVNILLVDMHHVITDAYSLGMLANEFITLYTEGELPEIGIQYKDFSQWQNSPEQRRIIRQKEQFWLKQFPEEPPVLNLPLDYPRPVQGRSAGGSVTFNLAGEKLEDLKALTTANSATIYMTLLALFNIFLAKLSGQEEIVVGLPVSTRTHADLEHVQGMFVNTLPIKNNPAPEKTYMSFLAEVKHNLLGAYENREYRFEDLVEKVTLHRDTGRNPLFDVMLNLLDHSNYSGATYTPGEQDENNNHLAGQYRANEYGETFAKFDLSLSALEAGEQMELNLDYRTELFKKKTIEGFTRYFNKILETVIAKPGEKIWKIEIISPEERKQILHEFNNTASEYPKEKTIHQLFEAQVEKTPDNVGLVGSGQWAVSKEKIKDNKEIKNTPLTNELFLDTPSIPSFPSIPSTHEADHIADHIATGRQPASGIQITYRELNEKSNQLAHHLQSRGVAPGTIVAIIMERSIEMITGIMGILKAGGAYLPIEPRYPLERIKYILKDSNAKIVLAGFGEIREYAELTELEKLGDGIAFIEIHTASGIRNPASGIQTLSGNQQPVSGSRHANRHAYIIYTSGSTGQPKGVLISHRNVMTYIGGSMERLNLTPGDTRTQTSAVTFDHFVEEVYPVLFSGAKLVIVTREDSRDIYQLVERIKRHQVTVLSTTPSVLKLLSGHPLPRSVRQLISGGDALTRECIAGIAGEIPIYNYYGPTETTVSAASYACPTMENIAGTTQTVPIGGPMTNYKIYILDRFGIDLPIGIEGEICIAGDAVAVGYLNKPELTAQRFIKTPKHLSLSFPNNQSPITHNRLYKTGDLARWLPDGNIEFLGRIDAQVKIRGFRIELGEIEQQLLKHPGIKEAIVLCPGDRPRGESEYDKYLCAYYVTNPRAPETEPDLRPYLAQHLPDFMIPSFFIKLEKIPLTPNGKIDRKKLSQFDPSDIKPSTEYVEPQTVNEKQITEIWREVLETNKIGIDDNFFEIGGNSLNILRVHNKLKEILKIEIPVALLFRFTTIHSLAQHLKQEETELHTTDKTIGETVNLMEETMKIAQKKQEEKDGYTGTEIAVIGMAGRFPGAKNITEFWENLKNGVESISFFSQEELAQAGIKRELLESPNYVKARGELEDSDCFDAAFFKYTPLEAEIMDPQIRVFHECAWEALENAGYEPGTYNGLIGLYAGASPGLQWQAYTLLSGKTGELGEFAANNLSNMLLLSTRVAYNLNLKGPAHFIQTACSTSLVAIHQACRAVMSGECHIALAGGVSVSMSQKKGYMYSEGMVMSPDGHCRAFDAKAKGTVVGSGTGIVVLKRLQTAIDDRDHIYALVKGSAVNNDGKRKVGYTAPSVEGQSAVIRTAMAMARVEPQTIGYVEAHGTGTVLGDPIEIEGLKLAFRDPQGTVKHPARNCAIGSVKTNVGHLDTAAGVAGFIKTVLMLKYKRIPPSLHFETPNPKIDFANTPFYVNTRLKEWKKKDNPIPLRAGVSSFGIGGTNAHAVLEEWRPGSPTTAIGETDITPAGKSTPPRPHRLIILSAKTVTALDKATMNLAKHFKNEPGIDIDDAAYTLQVGRKSMPHRRISVCSEVSEAVGNLSAPGTQTGKTLYETGYAPGQAPPVIFMFPGQGSQYVNMGLELYRTEPLFRKEMDRCFHILKEIMGYDLKEVIYPGETLIEETFTGRAAKGGEPRTGRHETPPAITRTGNAQPLLFAIEYSLAKLVMHMGIKPGAMIGHSIGEYTAAALAGVFGETGDTSDTTSLQNVLKIVALRGELMQKMPSGSMLAVSMRKKKLLPYLKENLELAAVNRPTRCVVSGTHEAVERLEKQLTEAGHHTTRLHTSHAFHSRMMDPILEEFETRVRQITLNKPAIPFISNLTGTWITDEEAQNPAYWSKHLRGTVRFADGLQELLKIEKSLLLEIGPGKALTTLATGTTAGLTGTTAGLTGTTAGLTGTTAGLTGTTPGLTGQKEEKREHKFINLVTHPKEKKNAYRYYLNQIGRLWTYGAKIDWTRFYANEKRNRIPLPTYPFERNRFRIEGDPLLMAGKMLSGTSQLQRKPDITDWFYTPSWNRTAITGGKFDEITPHHCWLLFVDDCGLSNQLVKKLKAKNQKVITVKMGAAFHHQKEDEFILNPAETQHNQYNDIFDRLEHQNIKPDKIVHLWNVTNRHKKELEIETAHKTLELGFYSIINIARAIAKNNYTKKIHITVISDNMQEVNGGDGQNPDKITLLGPVKVIPLEYPNIRCRSIDVILPEPGKHGEERLVGQLLEEMAKEPIETVVAFRGNYRWIHTTAPVKLENTGEKNRPLRQNGVYLVTGGLGGIGLALAEYLAKQVQAKLVLTGRSQFPTKDKWKQWLENNPKDENISRKIRKLRELEELGAGIEIFCADVSNREQMQ
ncbi:MAG: amino acid adenylation domain-containing protein, partial [bacterium]|nr:amino acid adenylation domain-containing protein [bacterium]